MIMNIKIFLTGGTIDGVDYDSLEKAPKNHQSLIPHFLKQAKVTAQYEIEELMIKDSRFITSEDREIISKKCKECEQNQIIITHGTFTLSETAKFLGAKNLGKTIVLVGCMVMGNQKDSDALFNLGAAIIAVQILPPDVYISMNGKIFRWDNVKKNVEKDLFEEERTFSKTVERVISQYNWERRTPLIVINGSLLAYRADPEKHAASLFDLYRQLQFKGNPNQKISTPSPEDWEDWWRGWLVSVPKTLEELKNGILYNKFYYTVIDNNGCVVAFMLAKCLGSGLSEEEIRKKNETMTNFQKDALPEEYLKDLDNFGKIAWMDIAGVTKEYAHKGIITDLEVLALQELYNIGIIEHVIGEILIAPYTNIGSIHLHEKRFAAVPICTRLQENTSFGNIQTTATWNVYEWQVFHRLVEARQNGLLPKRIEGFQLFKFVYLAALHRKDFSKIFE